MSEKINQIKNRGKVHLSDEEETPPKTIRKLSTDQKSTARKKTGSLKEIQEKKSNTKSWKLN